MGFPCGLPPWVSLVAQTVKNLPAMKRPGLKPWVMKIPWKREWLPTPVFLSGEFHEQRSLAGYSPWGCQELDTTEWLSTAQHSTAQGITRASQVAQGKESACNAGDTGDAGLIPSLSRVLGGGHGNPPQYSFLENPLDRGVWWAIVHRFAKSRTQLK